MAGTVLVVDDSASLRGVVRLMLERLGHTVVEAADGMQALRQVAEHRPVLMVCDLNMPTLNGLGLVRQVRANTKYADMPIVMLTTSVDPDQKAQAARHGAQAWIAKPVQAEVLANTVARLLERRAAAKKVAAP